MSDISSTIVPVRGLPLRLARIDRGSLVAAILLLLSVVALHLLKPRGISYFDVSTIVGSAVPLLLAALGQTIVVVAGGLDLSAGAIISLVNVALVTVLGESGLGDTTYTLAAFGIAAGIGAGIGAINGLLVGYVGLQPVVVTLATMFIVQGSALLVMPVPGGSFSDATSALFIGEAVPGLLPAPVLVALIAIAAWLALRNTRLGVALYAVGSDRDAAAANGLDVRRVTFVSYMLGGLCYGLAGLALVANTGAADPLLGAPMLLKIFAAVVLGGVVIGGGRGSAVGSALAALTLATLTTILLLSGLRTYFVPVVEGAILLGAVLLFALGRDLPAAAFLRRVFHGRGTDAVVAAPFDGLAAVTPGPRAARPAPPRGLRDGFRPLLRLAAPAYVLFFLTVLATAFIHGTGFSPGSYVANLLVFATFLAILGLGQGAVVISGGLDLSIAWTITLPAVVLTAIANGSDAQLAWVLPLCLLLGIAVGIVNGALVVGFRISPIIVTLATAGILEGSTLIFSGGAPTGYAPPAVAAFVTSRVAVLTPMVWVLLVFVVAAVLLLNGSVFGRRLAASGRSAWIATLSGVRTGPVTIAAYALSGLCAATVGILLVGFNSQANYDMGKPYLLASIAVVVLGGTDIRGGRGHYVAILGGALLFTALSSMLSATALPDALRSVIYGIVLLLAVLAMRRR